MGFHFKKYSSGEGGPKARSSSTDTHSDNHVTGPMPIVFTLYFSMFSAHKPALGCRPSPSSYLCVAPAYPLVLLPQAFKLPVSTGTLKKCKKLELEGNILGSNRQSWQTSIPVNVILIVYLIM